MRPVPPHLAGLCPRAAGLRGAGAASRQWAQGLHCAAAGLLLALPLLAAAAQPALGDGSQDALRSAGPQAARIENLWWLTVGVCAAVFAAVLLAFALALWRSARGSRDTPPDLSSLRRAEPALQRSVAWGAGVSAVLLLVLIGASAWTDRALARLPLQDALHIELTGQRWWWDVRYDDADPSKAFSTANELHIPVGRPVILTLKSADVIHSFWVPNLAGKKDLIPGRTATLQLRADRAGSYRGQCAEFCGLQHAWMALTVVAEEPERYAAWAEAQRRPAPVPQDATLVRGQQLFLAGTCAMCHAITGLPAYGRKAPDLTHLASRPLLAAGALPNTAENLARWIRDPQAIKPGVNMPAHDFAEEDLRALVAYLGSLK